VIIPEPRPLPEPFVDWLDRFLPEFPAQGAPGEEAGRRFDANHDGDRWTDFEEFLLGLNPTDANEPPAVWTEWVASEDGSEHFALCFKRRKGADEMADFVVEVSRNLQEWMHVPDVLKQPIIRDIDADLEEVMIGVSPDATVEGFPFARLRVNEK
jgi:hypothetical protein